MDQLLRREFLLQVLFTVGIPSFVQFSKLSVDEIEQKTLGQSSITDQDIETLYQALTVVA